MYTNTVAHRGHDKYLVHEGLDTYRKLDTSSVGHLALAILRKNAQVYIHAASDRPVRLSIMLIASFGNTQGHKPFVEHQYDRSTPSWHSLEQGDYLAHGNVQQRITSGIYRTWKPLRFTISLMIILAQVQIPTARLDTTTFCPCCPRQTENA